MAGKTPNFVNELFKLLFLGTPIASKKLLTER